MSNNEYTLGEAIQMLLQQYKLKSRIDKVRIKEKWAKLLGDYINRHTTEIFIKETTLYVRLDVPALRSELLYSKDKLIESLNKELGEELITNIIFM